MGAPLPWFPFYVDKWETDERTDALTLEEQGAFLRLLCWQWREGSISGSPAIVAAKLSVRSAKRPLPLSKRRAIAQRLLKDFFVPCGVGMGRMVNPKLAEIYSHQVSRSEKASEVAREAAARRAAIAERKPGYRSANARRTPGEVEVDVRSEIKKSLKTSAHANDNGKDEAA